MAKDKLKARPQIEGLDPLAGAERLHNPSNTEEATHYEVDNSEAEAEAKAAMFRKQNVAQSIGQQPGIPMTPAHKTKNSSKAEQAKVAKGRKE